jgi:threonine synthase
LAELRNVFTADCADEQETAATIRAVRREAGCLIDPHTAVAIAVAEKERRASGVPMVALATAHPAKFPAAVEAACGVRPALPDWLADLPHRPERQTVLAADLTVIEHFISSVSRVAREGAAA